MYQLRYSHMYELGKVLTYVLAGRVLTYVLAGEVLTNVLAG
jgi:hypothetical protein